MKEFPVLPDTTAAYLAGLFDGEGSVSILSSRGWRVRISVCSAADNGFLSKLYNECGRPGHLSSHRGRVNDRQYRPLHVWEMTGPALAWFLDSVLPWLRLKRQHAEIALDMYEQIKPRRKGRSLRLTARELATRKLLQLALEYAHLSSGSHRFSRWAPPDSKVAQRTRRVIREIGQVVQWKLAAEDARQRARGIWTGLGIPFPFYEASA